MTTGRDISTGREFALAVAKHFRLPPGQLFEPVRVEAGADSLFMVTLNIVLTPDDLKGIGAWMAEPDKEQEPEREQLAKVIEAQPVESFCTAPHQAQTRVQRAVYAAAVRAGRVLDYREAIAVVQALPAQEPR